MRLGTELKKQLQRASDAALCHHAAASGKDRNTVATLTGPKKALRWGLNGSLTPPKGPFPIVPYDFWKQPLTEAPA